VLAEWFEIFPRDMTSGESIETARVSKLHWPALPSALSGPSL
jgi:hypothetical protein